MWLKTGNATSPLRRCLLNGLLRCLQYFRIQVKQLMLSRHREFYQQFLKHCLNRTGSVISSDPSCKGGFAQFTTVSLKMLSDQVSNCLFWFVVSLQKWLAHLLLIRINGEIDRNKHFWSQRKQRYLLHYSSDWSFKDTVVNRALLSLHEESLKIMLTVSLQVNFTNWFKFFINKFSSMSVMNNVFYKTCLN